MAAVQSTQDVHQTYDPENLQESKRKKRGKRELEYYKQPTSP